MKLPDSLRDKEPHEMTLEEFGVWRGVVSRGLGGPGGYVDGRSNRAMHRLYIEEAIRDGKIVPPEILAGLADKI